MESLPDDVWHKILQIGVENERLDHADLCSLAIVNSHFDQLTQDSSLWATLLSRDFPFYFPHYFFEGPSKALYKRKHEREGTFKRLIESAFSWPDEPLFLLGRYRPFHLPIISYGSSSGSNFAQLETQPFSGIEANIFNVIVRGVQDGLTLHEEGDPVLSPANQATLKQGRNHYDENKSRKRFNNMSRPKVIPNCKSYIPMNRPPRRSVPRKI